MRSNHLVPLDVCLVLHSDVRAVFESLGDLSGVRRLILRAGVTTGERLAVVEGDVPPHADTWDADLAQRAKSGLRVIRGSGRIHERIDGVTLQITGGAFFQNHTAGAACLVELAGEALAIEAGDTLLDGYAGGGLFGATLGRHAARVVAVEVSPLAVSDLRHNLRAAGVGDHRVVKGTFEEEAQRLDEYWNVAVVDPPREGLGIGGVTAVTAAGPRTIAYVSCDPASLARDTRYLADAGYGLDWVTPVDLFPQTFHVEAVARFSRVRPTF
jgi:23S rRNA (uracil1939-C5)-methyltransferase